MEGMANSLHLAAILCVTPDCRSGTGIWHRWRSSGQTDVSMSTATYHWTDATSSSTWLDKTTGSEAFTSTWPRSLITGLVRVTITTTTRIAARSAKLAPTLRRSQQKFRWGRWKCDMLMTDRRNCKAWNCRTWNCKIWQRSTHKTVS